MDQLAPFAWPAALAFGALMVFILVMSGKIESFTGGKDGISMSIKQQNRSKSTEHFQNSRIRDIDDRLGLSAKRATKDLRRTIVYALSSSTNCANTKRLIGSTLLDPLFDAVDENDFKTHLSTANMAEYVNGKIDAIHEVYDEVLESTSLGCAAGDGENDLPTWDAAEPKIRDVVNRWAAQISEAVKDACRSKIDVYREYIDQFQSAKDEYMVKVNEVCIAKNQRYIEQLGGEP